jgi:hypothetical protein
MSPARALLTTVLSPLALAIPVCVIAAWQHWRDVRFDRWLARRAAAAETDRQRVDRIFEALRAPISRTRPAGEGAALNVQFGGTPWTTPSTSTSARSRSSAS